LFLILLAILSELASSTKFKYINRVPHIGLVIIPSPCKIFDSLIRLNPVLISSIINSGIVNIPKKTKGTTIKNIIAPQNKLFI